MKARWPAGSSGTGEPLLAPLSYEHHPAAATLLAAYLRWDPMAKLWQGVGSEVERGVEKCVVTLEGCTAALVFAGCAEIAALEKLGQVPALIAYVPTACKKYVCRQTVDAVRGSI